MPYLKKLHIVAVILATLSTGALADRMSADDKQDAIELTQAKVSLKQAVEMAEKHLNGLALKAEFERSAYGSSYEIEVVEGSKIYNVVVDADKGAVLSSRLAHTH